MAARSGVLRAEAKLDPAVPATVARRSQGEQEDSFATVVAVASGGDDGHASHDRVAQNSGSLNSLAVRGSIGP